MGKSRVGQGDERKEGGAGQGRDLKKDGWAGGW